MNAKQNRRLRTSGSAYKNYVAVNQDPVSRSGGMEMTRETDKLGDAIRAGLEVSSLRLQNNNLIWGIETVEATNVPGLYLVRYLHGGRTLTSVVVQASEVDEIRVRS